MLCVDVYSNGEQVGSIGHDGSKFVVAPSDSQLLQNILHEPVFIQRDGKLVDLRADDDPVSFLKGMCRHYKSQGVSASPAVER